jgi:hypothetical protein
MSSLPKLIVALLDSEHCRAWSGTANELRRALQALGMGRVPVAARLGRELRAAEDALWAAGVTVEFSRTPAVRTITIRRGPQLDCSLTEWQQREREREARESNPTPVLPPWHRPRPKSF